MSSKFSRNLGNRLQEEEDKGGSVPSPLQPTMSVKEGSWVSKVPLRRILEGNFSAASGKRSPKDMSPSIVLIEKSARATFQSLWWGAEKQGKDPPDQQERNTLGYLKAT